MELVDNIQTVDGEIVVRTYAPITEAGYTTYLRVRPGELKMLGSLLRQGEARAVHRAVVEALVSITHAYHPYPED